jgi:hypothetical protein
MAEVTEENYHIFLSYHGMNPETAEMVVRMYDHPELRKNSSVATWVDASKMLLKVSKDATSKQK